MIVYIKAENFRSFKKPIQMDFTVAASIFSDNETLKKIPVLKNHTFDTQKGVHLLKGAAIYGANASGKSNLVRVFLFFYNLFHQNNNNKLPDTTPYLFEKNDQKKAILLEICLFLEQKFWTYTIGIQDDKIILEKLTNSEHFNSNTEVCFSFDFNHNEIHSLDNTSETEQTYIKFLKTRLEQERTEPFLSGCMKFNTTNFKPVYEWLKTRFLVFMPHHYLITDELLAIFTDNNYQDFILSYLQAADTGIKKIKVKEKKVIGKINRRLENLLKEPPNGNIVPFIDHDNFKALKLTNGDIQEMELELEHYGGKNTTNVLRFGDESEGTKRFLFLAHWFKIIKTTDTTIVIDELDNSLHTLLCKELILQLDNLKGQLFFTTHDTNLLDFQLLRTDEIWFVKKDKTGASHLKRLSDYAPTELEWIAQKNLSLESVYLNGLLGAVPNVKQFDI